MFKFFKKPTIKTKLVNKGAQVKVRFSNADADQIMTMIFITIQEFAKNLNVEPRFMMNKIIELDKTMVRTKKVEIKKAKGYIK